MDNESQPSSSNVHPVGGAASGNVSIPLSTMLGNLSVTRPKSCIFRVHKHIREGNEKAYEPEVIAIGPYHRNKENVRMMEEHKLRYLRSFLGNRIENVENYVGAVRGLDQKVREFYDEPLDLNADELAKMMVVDGCFIIQLVYKYDEYSFKKDDPFVTVPWVACSMRRDLMLFENQIPFFILLTLLPMIKNSSNEDTFKLNIVKFFTHILPDPGQRRRTLNDPTIGYVEIKHLLDLIHGYWNPLLPCSLLEQDSNSTTPYSKIKYLLDLYGYWNPILGSLALFGNMMRNHLCSKVKYLLDFIHICWNPSLTSAAGPGSPEVRNPSLTSGAGGGSPEIPDPSMTSDIEDRNMMPCATELQDAGVKFRRSEEQNFFHISFNNGIFKISHFKVTDWTGSILRNLIAHEQYYRQSHCLEYVVHYVNVLDRLIDSSKDVKILRQNGILQNWLGNDEVVAKMFNKMMDSVVVPTNQLAYPQIFKSVNYYHKKRRHRWMAKLRHNYLNSPWGVISILAASILLLLALTQTIFTVFPRG